MRTAIVTGASKGLGAALTAGLVEQGWTVIVDARHADELAAATASMAGGPGAVVAIGGDVTDAAHRAALVAAAAARGGLDLLVNNAGALGPSPLPPLARYPLAELRAVFEANVVAPLGLVQDALPLLRAAHGAVINVTSDAAVEAYEGWGGYGSSKAALEQASRVLAVEEPDVAVWWVDPGDMRTAMHQAAFPGEDISDRPEPAASVPGILALIQARPPSGRYALAHPSRSR